MSFGKRNLTLFYEIFSFALWLLKYQTFPVNFFICGHRNLEKSLTPFMQRINTFNFHSRRRRRANIEFDCHSIRFEICAKMESRNHTTKRARENESENFHFYFFPPVPIDANPFAFHHCATVNCAIRSLLVTLFECCTNTCERCFSVLHFFSRLLFVKKLSKRQLKKPRNVEHM